jgi:Protein of unknown function (DUF2855)
VEFYGECVANQIGLYVNRSSIGNTQLASVPMQALADGAVRLEVEHFALTANNITYAQFGDMLDYWNFYPVDSQIGSEWGLVPAMGWGRVTESNVVEIVVGSRYYGWFPMVNLIDIHAKSSATGFRDSGAHRAKHAPVYRSFVRTDVDDLYTTSEDEHRHELLRGLFLTGFLIDAFFAVEKYFAAEQVIVLSASSKTALGYAHAARAAGETRLVGVTSAANGAFVEATCAYDHVVTYEQLDEIEAVRSVIIDMAGSGSTVAALHARLGDLVQYSMIVGKSHHDASPAAIVSGPQPAMFFAPTSIEGCLAEWGAEEYARRTKAGLASFLEGSQAWLSIEQHVGPAATELAWQQLFSASVAPNVGLIASLLS